MCKIIRCLILLIYLLINSNIISQTLTARDRTTLEPLINLTLHSNNSKIYGITDLDGKVDASPFKGADSIWFNHVSYKTKVYSYEELQNLNFNISFSEKLFSLDELVISASRAEERLRDVVHPIQLIKSKELTFSNQQNTADVMQSSGNVLVQKSQQGGGSPIIRGFETNKVLIVVDGVRMNNAIYRGGHLQNVLTIDNSILDKVEIVFGPGSVVYGSDALGGVMHFTTRKPLLSDSSNTRVSSRAYTRYSTASSGTTGHVDFSLGRKKIGSLTSITYSKFGDLLQGNNRNPFYGDWGKRTFYVERINNKDSMLVNENVNLQKESGYQQYDILQKFLFKQNDKISHELNLQYSTSSNVPRYDRLTLMTGLAPKYAEWYYGPQKRLLVAYSLNLISDKGFYDNAKIIVGYQNVEESRNTRKFNNNVISRRNEKLNIITVNADFANKLNKHEIRYGLDGWYNDVNSIAYQENIITNEQSPLDTRYPDGGSVMQSVAAYFTHTLELSKKIILTDGLRLNSVQLNSKFNDTTFFPFSFNEVKQINTVVNGNVGLIYMPNKSWRLTLLASSGFRAPNVDDLSKIFDSTPGKVIVPNPNIKPEYTYNLDLGISKTINDQITIGGTGYYTIYKDVITTGIGTFNGQDSIIYNDQLSQVIMNNNAGEAFIYGFNLYLNADITSTFSMTNTINYTFARMKTDSTLYPLDHIPPVFGKTSFNLKLNKFRGEFVVQYNGEKKSSDYNLMGEDNHSYSANPIEGYMPSWVTLNIRTAYQFNQQIQLQVALENILNKNYRVFASNIGAPARNFIVTLRGSF